MEKNNSKIDKNNLEKVSSGKGEKKLSKKKISMTFFKLAV